MKMLFILAWLNLWRNKRRTLITASSVFFAVILALVAESMTKGSHEAMISNMVKLSTGYLQLQDSLYEDEPSVDHAFMYDDTLKQIIRQTSGIAYVVPRFESFMLAATEKSTRPVMLRGVDFEAENRLNDMGHKLLEGNSLEAGDQAVLLADGLAERLKMDVGDSIILVGQGFRGMSAAGIYPVKGIMKISLPRLNDQLIFMPLAATQQLFGAEDRLTALLITPEEKDQTGLLAQQLRDQLDPKWFKVLTWKQMMPTLLQSLELDRASGMMIIYMLYLVVGFGILGTVLTMMLERQREFGILLSVGMKRSQLALITFVETVFISMIGVAAGLVGGFPIILYMHHHPIRFGEEMEAMFETYGMEAVMPFALDLQVFSSQAVVVLLITLVIGLYPVLKVFRMNILKAARN
ncbi:MAG: FtsX-like permease family protein [Bacteroidetes bacterium]|jgi:putative ABC transport system permease protein|nr:FtsX-like permease family protein [Bacteroidota bacterium]